MTLQDLIDQLTQARKLGATEFWIENDTGNALNIMEIRVALQGQYVVIETRE